MPKHNKKDEALKPKNLYLKAVRLGDLEATRAFLDAGVVVDVHSGSKSTALMRAAWEGHEQIVNLLLERGADVNAFNEARETALTRAAAQGQFAVVELLLAAGAKVDGHPDHRHAYITTPLGEALLNGHMDIAVLLRGQGANPDLAIGKIVAQRRGDLLDVLLGMGADVNEETNRGYTPLMRSATMGDVEMTEALLARGANPNAVSQNGYTPLGQAFMFEEVPAVITMLLHNGARVRFLNEAVLLGDVEAVHRLLEEGADVEDYRPYSRGDRHHYTPIKIARKRGNEEIIRVLLAAGAEQAMEVN